MLSLMPSLSLLGMKSLRAIAARAFSPVLIVLREGEVKGVRVDEVKFVKTEIETDDVMEMADVGG